MAVAKDAAYRPMSNDEKVALQQVIMPVVTVGLDGKFTAVGTGFLVCSLGRHGIILTAAHVMQQIQAIDRPYKIHHSSTPNEFLTTTSESDALTRTRMLVLYRESLNSGHFAEIAHVYINNPLDIALCSVTFPDHVPKHVKFGKKLAIDSSPPNVGTPIISAGYGDMEFTQICLGTADQAAAAMLDFQLDYRHGKILNVFPSGQRWPNPYPSFQIDAPISSGMSGGPIINKTYGNEIVACGVNVHDLSVAERNSFNKSGSGQNAIAAMLWPCMGIAITHAQIDGEFKPVRLVELVARGYVDDRGNAPKHLGPLPAPGTDTFRMRWC